MTKTLVSRSDEECARIANASLKELAESRHLRREERGGEVDLLLADDGKSYRFVAGPRTTRPLTPGERTIVVGWGDVPLPFALVPHPGLTYFDIRFGVHSRELDPVATELKACLEHNGCAFKTFSSAHRARRPLRVLRDRLGR